MLTDFVQGNPVGRVGRGAWLPGTSRQRLGDPFAHVGLAPGPGRAEQVEADAAGDGGQPGAGGFDGVLLLPGHGVPAGVGLLDGVLGFGQGAEEPVGEIDQLPPLADQPRPGPDQAGCLLARMGWSWCALSWSHLLSPIRHDSAPECEAGRAASHSGGARCRTRRETKQRHVRRARTRTGESAMIRIGIILGSTRPNRKRRAGRHVG